MSYVPPAGNAANFNFKTAYVVPAGNNVVLDFGAAGTIIEPDDQLPWQRPLARFEEERWQYVGPKRFANVDLLTASTAPRAMPNLTALFEEADNFLAYARRKPFSVVAIATVRFRAAQIIG